MQCCVDGVDGIVVFGYVHVVFVGYVYFYCCFGDEGAVG